MFGLGITELLIIFMIIFLIFGVNKLPQIGDGLGKAISGFRRSISETTKLEDTKQEGEKN
jgi:sec-independent protein translocase protein TatA